MKKRGEPQPPAVGRTLIVRRTVLGCLGLTSIAVSVVIGAAQAQSAHNEDKQWRFAVVSIRRNTSGGPQQFGEPTADGYHMGNMFLAAPIVAAYVPTTGGAAMYADDQIAGMPGWAYSDDEHYDISAKVDDADLGDWQNPAKQPVMMKSMLQAMLADRLKLSVHRSTKEGPVYSLVLGKNGRKFRETDPAEPHSGAYPFPGGGMVAMEVNGGEVVAHYFGITMGQLTATVLGSTGHPIRDNTGLSGKYDITIRKPAAATQPEAGPPGAGAATDSEATPFSLAEQLGLKLQLTRGTIETLVIDHVERPSEN